MDLVRLLGTGIIAGELLWEKSIRKNIQSFVNQMFRGGLRRILTWKCQSAKENDRQVSGWKYNRNIGDTSKLYIDLFF